MGYTKSGTAALMSFNNTQSVYLHLVDYTVCLNTKSNYNRPWPNFIKLLSSKYCSKFFPAKQKLIGAPVTTIHFSVLSNICLLTGFIKLCLYVTCDVTCLQKSQRAWSSCMGDLYTAKKKKTQNHSFYGDCNGFFLYKERGQILKLVQLLLL